MDKIINQLLQSPKLSFKSAGKSMWPVFYENDLLYFRKIPFKKIRVNDLVVIKKGKQLISHRVVYKTDKYLITKGDNSLYSDGKIYSKQVVGKIYQIKRNSQIFTPESLYLVQSTHYFSEIVKIKKEFDRQKINYVFLKGLPLHLYYEKSHPSRVYYDCDILVDKKDYFKVVQILTNRGYKKYDQSLSAIHDLLRQKQIESPYYKLFNNLLVTFDLHLEIDWMSQQLGRLEEFYPQSLINQLTEEFLQKKRIIKINKESFFILNTQYLILYLALHLFHHNFCGAFRYDFLDKIIRYSSSRQSKLHRVGEMWPVLASKINDFKLNNFVYPVFVLLKKHYQTPISETFFRSIKPVNPLTRKLINKIIKVNIFDDHPRIRAGVIRIKNLFLLSPKPIGEKLLIFFNHQVIYSIIWVIIKKIAVIKKYVFLLKIRLKPRK